MFINLITEGTGGIEHKNSTVLMTSRWRTRVRRHYVDWLSLVSHEFFHTWNVKRLRPVELGPFEYERENYTKSLWVAEGFTDYYADLVAVRAGVMSPEEALGSLSETIASLQTTPGRLVQSVEEASFDAWVRYYRPDENTPNSTISYYTKGAVVGFLLDLEIRRATNNARSLDDLMTQAYARYSGAKGLSRPPSFGRWRRKSRASTCPRGSAPRSTPPTSSRTTTWDGSACASDPNRPRPGPGWA